MEPRRGRECCVRQRPSSQDIPLNTVVDCAVCRKRYSGFLEYVSTKTQKKNEEKLRTRANGVWQVTDIFYIPWNKRRLDILADYEKNASHKERQTYSALADLVESTRRDRRKFKAR